MSDASACRVGMWASILAALTGVAYLAVLVVGSATQGLAYPPSPFVQLAAGIVTFVVASLLVVVFAAIHQVPGRRGVLGTSGFGFALLFAAMVSINRFVQLTVIRQAPASAAGADLARFMPYSQGSVMLALEMLGWGFFIALAAFFVAPLFAGDRLQAALRWLLVAFGALSLVAVTGYVTNTALIAVGFVAWGPVLTAISVLLAIHYWKALRATATPRDGAPPDGSGDL